MKGRASTVDMDHVMAMKVRTFKPFQFSHTEVLSHATTHGTSIAPSPPGYKYSTGTWRERRCRHLNPTFPLNRIGARNPAACCLSAPYPTNSPQLSKLDTSTGRAAAICRSYRAYGGVAGLTSQSSPSFRELNYLLSHLLVL
jgi:hypothetical protein